MEQNLGSVIARLRHSKKMTQASLASKMRRYGCDVTHLYISKWENGYSSPSVTQFLALCAALDVEDIQWEFAGRHTGILAGFNETGRKKALELLDLLFKIEEYRDELKTRPIKTTRLLKLYSIGVSAGFGNFLDESDYEMIKPPDNAAENADYAVRISGDSMAPLYQDQQIIWVKEQSALRHGDIGIFYLRDSAYCKKYIIESDGVYLRSLNDSYSDIKIKETDTFKILGKVVS